jgi:predicted nucleic acid-binding protein
MRIMLDANVLYSAILFPNGRMEALMEKAAVQNRLVLCDYVLDELEAAVGRDAPHQLPELHRYLRGLSHELVHAPKGPPGRLAHIRDEADYPVLHSAIVENVDVLVTGDKDFEKVGVKRPRIMKPADFLNDNR